MTTSSARSRLIASALAGVGLLEVLATVTVVVVLGGRGGFDPVASFVIPNAPAGIAFVTCGLVIVRHHSSPPDRMAVPGWRAREPDGGDCGRVGVLLGRGRLAARGDADPHLRVLGELADRVVPRLPPRAPALSRRSTPLAAWRAVVVLQLLAWLGMELDQGLHPVAAGMPPRWHSWTAVGWADDLGRLWLLTGAAQLASMLAVVAGLVVRYRRGEEVVRRRLLWLMLAGGAAMISLAVFFLGQVSPLILLTFVLIPVSVGIAIVRYDLLDVRLVVSRAIAYAVLTALLLTAYVALVWLGGPGARAAVARRTGGSGDRHRVGAQPGPALAPGPH